MDSVTLRKTHFKLGKYIFLNKNKGDYANPYTTSVMEQNKNIENNKRSISVAQLDPKLKEDLRKSHFIMGNFEPNYKTVFQSEYYDKSNPGSNNKVQAHNIERSLRSHNYILGSDKPDYKSETQAKFVTPSMENAGIK